MNINMIWQVSDVKDDKEYKLQLCQTEGGKRYFSLVESSEDLLGNSNAYFSTNIISNELLRKRDLISLAEVGFLENGKKYYVDSHGIWFTEEEVVGLNKGISFDEIPWVTTKAPKLPSS